MAAIPKPISAGYNIDLVAPSNQYVAVCLDVVDQFGVERRKFQSEEVENQDITRFVFGIVCPNTNVPYLVQTFEYKISGASGSNLIKFLTMWMGKAPEAGWDYCELKGSCALIAVEQTMSKSQTPTPYSKITGVFPVPAAMISTAPQTEWFDTLIAQALQASGGVSPSQVQPATGEIVTAQPLQGQPLVGVVQAQAPVAQAPVAQAPVAQAPVAQAPVAQAPVAQAPLGNASPQASVQPATVTPAQVVVPNPVTIAQVPVATVAPPATQTPVVTVTTSPSNPAVQPVTAQAQVAGAEPDPF